MDFKGIMCDHVDWLNLAENGDKWWAVVGRIMNIWVVLDVWNFLTSLGSTSVSRKAVLHGVN
jgi:hypothetical protein